MPRLAVPPFKLLERFFARIADDQPELLPTCRWLVLGPELAPLILPDVRPSVVGLTTLLRWLRDREPSLNPCQECV